MILGKRNFDLEYKLRTCVYAVIQNEQDEFLCVSYEDGNFYLVGGEMEAGETLEMALKREALEETGHLLEIGEEIGKAEKHWVSKKYPAWSQHNRATLFVGKILQKVTEPIESEKMHWVTLEQLKSGLFHEHHRILIENYFSEK